MVKWQFLGFKGITRFGSVIGVLSYFSLQLNFPGATIKFQEISKISRSCKHSEIPFTAWTLLGGLPLYNFFFRTPETLKIPDNYQDIFQSVDTLSTTKVYQNEVLNIFVKLIFI